MVRSAPGVPVIRNINWGGLKTLYVKEVRRFFKVQLQTVWAPAIQTLLYLIVFTTALGGDRPVAVGGQNVAFADFVGPGLIVMGMMTSAFANASFSLLVGKIQGTIVDYLQPPLSTMELLTALVGGAMTRAFECSAGFRATNRRCCASTGLAEISPAPVASAGRPRGSMRRPRR